MARRLFHPVDDITVVNPKRREFSSTVEDMIGPDAASRIAARFGRTRKARR